MSKCGPVLSKTLTLTRCRLGLRYYLQNVHNVDHPVKKKIVSGVKERKRRKIKLIKK